MPTAPFSDGACRFIPRRPCK